MFNVGSNGLVSYCLLIHLSFSGKYEISGYPHMSKHVHLPSKWG